jgi:hypothetical protein
LQRDADRADRGRDHPSIGTDKEKREALALGPQVMYFTSLCCYDISLILFHM